MPYIAPERRHELREGDVPRCAGDVAFLAFSAAMEFLDGLDRPARFADYAAAMAGLESARAEFYRRRVAPYEDAAIQRNGDV